MFENIMKFFKKLSKKEEKVSNHSRDAAKERLHLVLMQDRANVSADFLELMKQEIIDVIKKYIDIDETAIDVKLTNRENEDGTNGAPALYANIPIINIKNEKKKEEVAEEPKIQIKEEGKQEEKEINKDNCEEKEKEEVVKEQVVEETLDSEVKEKSEKESKEEQEENKEKELKSKD